MELQSAFYSRITSGEAGEATSLMARIALNLGHDARAFPVDLSEIVKIRLFNRDLKMVGFNELFTADFVRASLMADGIKPWEARHVKSFLEMDGVYSYVHPIRRLPLIKPHPDRQ